MAMRILFAPTWLTCLVACALLNACSALQGAPERSFGEADELAALQRYQSASVLGAFDNADDAVRGGLTREGYRNEVLEARVQDMNLRFDRFERTLFVQGTGANIGVDWLVLALSGAGSLAGAGVANALSATTAGITGARSSFDKEALRNSTLTVLVGQMIADRRTVLARIRQGEAQNASAYPLARGFADLDDYFNAGTLYGSLSSVASHAGEQAQAAQLKLDTLAVVVPAPVQAEREPVAAYVKTLEPGDLARLCAALGLAPQPDSVGALGEILNAISAATTVDRMNQLEDRIEALFGKEFQHVYH